MTDKEGKREHARYMREYRKKNPEKIRDINRRYWERKAQERRLKSDNAEITKAEP